MERKYRGRRVFSDVLHFLYRSPSLSSFFFFFRCSSLSLVFHRSTSLFSITLNSLTLSAIPLLRIFSGFSTPFIFFRSLSFLIFFSILFNFFHRPLYSILSFLLSQYLSIFPFFFSSSHPSSLFFIITPLSLVSRRFRFFFY